MRHWTVLLWFALLSLAGCTTSENGGSTDDSFTLPSPPGGAKSIALPTSRSISGVLSFDDIEGGCAFLLVADGTRYEVIYPEGWHLERSSGVLHGPAGVVVRAGDTITVSGALATGRSSICQVGPIFQADTVEVTPS